MTIVYIGMGSNLDDPKQQLMQAKKSLQQLHQTRFLACSDLYQSDAMTLPEDTQSQDDYINAVIKLDTQLNPHQLLDECQKLKQLRDV